jgi:hypothetical protein
MSDFAALPKSANNNNRSRYAIVNSSAARPPRICHILFRFDAVIQLAIGAD